MKKSVKDLIRSQEHFLAPYAMKSSLCLGRVYPEQNDPARLPYQRDRDRIIHSKSFRRLQAKTQVFVAFYGDHYRDRMTHSIEVSQIARGISRSLGLNEDLCESLALAHDLGHPPFGHGGEHALDEMMRKFGSHFEHNEQSRRILEKLEKPYPHCDGLNLTKEVLDGLLKHNPHNYHTFIKFEISPHLESQVVDLADEIAYTNHDIDDGLRSGLITVTELSRFKLWERAHQNVLKRYGRAVFKNDIIGETRLQSRIVSNMVSQMILDLVKTTSKNLEKNNINNLQKVRDSKIKLVGFSKKMNEEINQLRAFLLKNFYYNTKVLRQIKRGQKIIKKLFLYYLDKPDRLPAPFPKYIALGEKPEIVVKDYIAGMTDHFAIEACQKIK